MGQSLEPAVYAKQLVALGRVLQTLREEDDIDVLVETTLAYLQTEFDYRLIWIGLYDRLDHRLVGKGGTVPKGDSPLLRQRFNLVPGDLLEQVVIQQRPVGVPNLQDETRAGEWRKAAQQYDIQGTMVFPIRYKDRCFGVALLGSHLWGVSPRSDDKARLSMLFGGLGGTLYQIEADWHRQQTRHSDQPLSALVSEVRLLPNFTERLAAVVEHTHEFVMPSRTNIYWFERERRYFWRRVSNRQRVALYADLGQSASGITVQDLGSFYEALSADRLVSIGEEHSSLKTDVTSKLMKQIRARSLMAAPILSQGELLGFLAVEGTEARIWAEEEKNFVRAAAQLVAMVAPLEHVEENLEQIRRDRVLTAEIARAIYTDDDWRDSLQTCADNLCKHLKAERFIVLLHDSDRHIFEVCYQAQPANRRPVSSPLPLLPDTDRKMLERSQDPIGIESFDEDLRLQTWREALVDVGIRAALVASVGSSHNLEGVIVLGYEVTRAWSQSERNVVRTVSQQIGLILHQWQLQRQATQQQDTFQTVDRGLVAIQQATDLDRLERAALQHLAHVLQVPLVALVSWQPGQTTGRIITSPNPNPGFSINTGALVPITTDKLIQGALWSDGLVQLAVGQLPAETRQWLSGVEIGQVVVMALRTSPVHEPTGVIIVVDGRDRQWLDRHLNAFGILVNQLAWFRRYLTLTQTLHTGFDRLEQLNWYKLRRIDDLCRTIATGIKRFQDLASQVGGRSETQPLQELQVQQVIRQLDDALQNALASQAQEQWDLVLDTHAMPITGLLKRALDRIEPLVQQQQLWVQVHNQQGNLLIHTDIVKVELILSELLLTACQRCEHKGRIDIWCRSADPRWLEISTTDSGTIDPAVLEILQAKQRNDMLIATTLDVNSGLHLLICQKLIRQLGGELNLYKLEDSRVLSRLVLPLRGSHN